MYNDGYSIKISVFPPREAPCLREVVINVAFSFTENSDVGPVAARRFLELTLLKEGMLPSPAKI
jgi:hypothetical protein